MGLIVALSTLIMAINQYTAECLHVSGNSQIDLLEGLHLHNTSYHGVRLASGPFSFSPAISLEGKNRDVRVSQLVLRRITTSIRDNSEITFLAAVRQEPTNSASLFSFTNNDLRLLELQSSGRKDEIRLHYMHNGSSKLETFSYKLADNIWHKVALSVSGSEVSVYVDCQMIYRRAIPRPDTTFNVNSSLTSLWVGQRSPRLFLFKGIMQDLKFVFGSYGVRAQCPHIETECPTCGQFENLDSLVKGLADQVKQLSNKLLEYDKRIKELEDCDCQKACHINGTVYSDGASWQQKCDICSCVHGNVMCRPFQCPRINCKHPVLEEGECCATCRKQCYIRGKLYDDGETISPLKCVECHCEDGIMRCLRIDKQSMCPVLTCPTWEQFDIDGKCCKFCPEEYCANGHKCHVNATCRNLKTNYTCQCNEGYQGDGYECQDIDECKSQGGRTGHHCRKHSKCVNTPGSYRCDCNPGYIRNDAFSCIEHNECHSGQHNCHKNAKCINNEGSFACECNEGYTGDGVECHPICDTGCLNGGECLAPGKCSCRKGFTGDNCEDDIDECALGTHNCHPKSTCMNMPGWHYCACSLGYRSVLSGDGEGVTCSDIDECSTGEHTCHSTAFCENLDGSFQCHCPNDSKVFCSKDCSYGGQQYRDGQSWYKDSLSCERCACEDGVVQCESANCDCLSDNIDYKCCPQCDLNSTCPHQTLPGVLYKNGQKWIHECQTCECLHSEIDCWPAECPPVSCKNPIQKPGDCCPRCSDDPCKPGNISSIGRSGQPCSYLGQYYSSGNEWTPLQDKCTTCTCKDGQVCCRFALDCFQSTTPLPQSRTYRRSGLGTQDTSVAQLRVTPVTSVYTQLKTRHGRNIVPFRDYSEIQREKHKNRVFSPPFLIP